MLSHPPTDWWGAARRQDVHISTNVWLNGLFEEISANPPFKERFSALRWLYIRKLPHIFHLNKKGAHLGICLQSLLITDRARRVNWAQFHILRHNLLPHSLKNRFSPRRHLQIAFFHSGEGLPPWIACDQQASYLKERRQKGSPVQRSDYNAGFMGHAQRGGHSGPRNGILGIDIPACWNTWKLP